MARYFEPTSLNNLQKASVANAATNNYSAFIIAKPLSFTGLRLSLMCNGYGVDFGGGGWWFYIQNNTGELRVDFSFVANFATGLRTVLGRWNRMAMIRRSGTTYAFLNGVKSKLSSASAPTLPINYYTVGARPNAVNTKSEIMNGGLKWPSVWGRAISDAEAIALTSGIILPYQIPANLDQCNPLYGNGSVEKPFRAGGDLTATGTLKYPDPPRLRFGQANLGKAPSWQFYGRHGLLVRA